MQINNFITEISAFTSTVSSPLITRGLKAKKLFFNCTIKKIEGFLKTDFWKKGLEPNLKPLKECYISPLDKLDYKILGGSLGVAIGVSSIGALFLGAASLPITAGIGTLIVMGAYQITRQRVEKKFNKEACKEIDKILSLIEKLKNIQNTQKTYNVIVNTRNNLHNRKYNHLEAPLKELDKEISKLQKRLFPATIALTAANLKTATSLFKQHLKSIKGTIVSNLANNQETKSATSASQVDNETIENSDESSDED